MKKKIDYANLGCGIIWIVFVLAFTTYEFLHRADGLGRGDYLLIVALTLFVMTPGFWMLYMGLGGYHAYRAAGARTLRLTPAELQWVRQAMTDGPQHHEDAAYREAYYKVEQADRAARLHTLTELTKIDQGHVDKAAEVQRVTDRS